MVEAMNDDRSDTGEIGSSIEPPIQAFGEFLTDVAESSKPAQNYILAKLEHFQAEIV